MVGVPFLVSRCDCGPSVRIGWPLPCLRRKRGNDRRAEEEHQKQTRARRADGAEGQIAEQVQRAEQMREIGEPGQHDDVLHSPAARCEKCDRSAATIGPIALPFEPLTMTTSPPRAASKTDWLDVGRALGPGAAHRLRRGVEQPRASAARRRTEDRPCCATRSRGELGMQLRAAARPSSSMSPSTAMRRPPAPGLGRAKQRRARRASKRDWRCSFRRSA